MACGRLPDQSLGPPAAPDKLLFINSLEIVFGQVPDGGFWASSAPALPLPRHLVVTLQSLTVVNCPTLGPRRIRVAEDVISGDPEPIVDLSLAMFDALVRAMSARDGLT